MAKLHGFIVCIVILVLDVLAGILGIEAQVSQNKIHHRRFRIFECREPSQQAFKLGLSAAIILALAHIIGNLLAGCNIICICSAEELQRSSSTRLMAAASSTLSWIVFAVGFALLMAGTMANNRSRVSCGFSFAHHKLLSIGGVLCFVHGILFAGYYAAAAAEREEIEDHHHNPRHRAPPVSTV